MPAQLGRRGGGGTQDNSVKDLFDRIGGNIQQKVHTASKKYFDELHGDLSRAKYPGDENPEKSTPQDPCDLDHSLHTNVTIGGDKEYPCGNGTEERFSDTKGSECNKNKIKGNKDNEDKEGKSEGACAPFRRLHLCDKNLQNINDYEKINNTHNLLLEVCLAAKYEGQSISGYYPQYHTDNSGSTMCTVLARSFADIGDIVRGRDLYRGDRNGKKKLESNLKTIFKKIYDNLVQNNADAKQHYGGDENYYKLREDWWELNREKVWKAITCNAEGSLYFRPKCSTETWSQDKCRCANTGVPTNFDYVPQYLRWFEEWSEDFCRKRKKKLENARKNCRGRDGSGEERYCDLNGYDCKKTAKGKNKYKYEEECIKCSAACIPFGPWIDIQKQEFEKQREKYINEISGSRRKKRSISSDTYKGYDENFYNIFKREYGDVDSFLDLLSKETACKSQLHDEGRFISINFKNYKNPDIFSHTEYCRACAWCGTRQKNGKWEAENDEVCARKEKKTYEKENITDIQVLTPEKEKKGILKKYEKFCKNSDGNNRDQIKKWQCYYDENIKNSEENNNCIQGEWETFTQDKTFRSYYFFFWIWVTEMLIDSIEWRTQLKSCINNQTKTCKNGCNKNCDCYKRWVDKKKTEWKKIKDHFSKQKDMKEYIGEGGDPSIVLAALLKKKQLLEIIQDTYGNSQETEHIEELLDEEENEEDEADAPGTEQNSIIDKLLQHEEKEAGTCLDTHKDPCPKPPGDKGAGRSLPGEPEEEHHSDVESESDDEDVDEETAVEDEVEETVAEVTEVDGVKPCEIVDELFKDGSSLKEACAQKYGPKAPTSWKCIPSDITATSGEPTGSSGATCIPPRRRKLYVGGLSQWADKLTTQARDGPLDTDAQSPSNSRDDAALRDAFIKSAAIETFFLWDKYKKEKEIEKKQQQDSGLLGIPYTSAAGDMTVLSAAAAPKLPSPQLNGLRVGVGVPGAGIPGAAIPGPHPPAGLPGATGQAQLQPQPLKPLNGTLGDDNNPQSKLEKGEIPTDFLRLMFYTLADYRDICIGDEKVIEVLKASGDKNIETINKKIKTILNGDTSPPTPPVTQNSEKKREQWWKTKGEHIWKGMICALTYKDNTDSGPKGTNNIEKNNDVYKKFFGNTPDKPGTPTGTYQSTYKYETVELKEEDDQSGAKPQTVSPSSDTPTTLDSFIKRPPYFRYLEEWGQNFCKERKKRLEKIKVDCKVDEDDPRRGKKSQKCSAYGEHCEDNLSEKYDTLPSFLCPDCGKECRKYKTWIERKKMEFDEQKKTYNEQKGKYKEGYYNGFYTKLQTYHDAKDFLKNLGTCSKTDNENGEDNIDFANETKTFGHEKYCKPCSEFKINCKNGNCNNDKGEECTGNNKTITAENIKKINDPNGNISMLVSDRNKNGFKDVLKECADADIFKGIRKDEWTCGNVCGYVVCKPITSDGKENNEQIIIIRALIKHWVDNFLQDYNKIRKKLNPCTKNYQDSTCISGCKNKCTCVEKWISTKKEEWEKIKELYLQQYKNTDKYYPVKTIFEELDPQTERNKAIKPCKSLDDFKKSCGLNGTDNTKTSEEDKINDVIDCMLNKLETKVKTCKDQAQTSGSPEAQCETSAPVEDDDEEDLLLEEEEQNQVKAPEICGEMKEETKEEEDDKCGEPESTTPKDTEAESEQNPEQTPEAPLPKKPEVPPAKVPEVPKKEVVKPKPKRTRKIVKRSLLPPILGASGFPWTVGIAFAALSYFVLKKKTKASVGNLFQILQIPKSDYDIPTLKSSNRYIPYASDRYKGKTYIYMEGDSSGDEKYAFMSDTTDVTSSESEYEELDINDIYVPGSPKYKTLIEVVLEPSKRDTPMNRFTDDEWNQLKHDFISNMLQNQPNDVPNDYRSGNVTLNTQPNTLYFDNPEEKPFITSIHDRNLYSGEEYNYNVNMVNNDIPINSDNNVYSGIDLINDSLNNNNVDIYDELLKRKENELFGTNHPKHTNTHNVTKSSNSDPIDNQLDLFHTWLDRHRDMCEQWNNKEEVLDKLKEEWNKDNNSGDIHTSDSNKTLNTDVSIQIHMDNPKPINQFNNMDTILEDLDKYNEPYYDVQDDIYYDVNDHDASTVDTNAMDVPSKVQIEMDVNTKLVKEKYPIADVWDI
ncbi:erythrocyte membrane protein 1, PfEMP1, putative [Plasmodium sp.]|nr:erythrocyte membrane protein 1, PfEMP1, putative [Plasmodium sp.]